MFRSISTLLNLSHSQSQNGRDAETANSITEEWLPMAARNKDGKGDGTGNIPDEALKILGMFVSSA